MQELTIPKYFYSVAFMLMASAFLPLVFNNLPPMIRSHHLWTSIWVISLIFIYPKFFLNRMMFYLLSYGFLMILCVNTLWINMDVWNSRMLIKEFYEISIGISVITYFFESKDYLGLARIAKWSIVFLVITAIMTIISSIIDPNYARNIYGIGLFNIESEREEILSFKKLGGGNYGTAEAFMCLFPIFIYYYKNINISLLSKKLIITFSVIIILALIGLQIFANIFIGFVFCVMAFSGMKKKIHTLIILCLFLIVIIITPNEIYVENLVSISNSFKKNSELNIKFRDLAAFVKTGSDAEDKSTEAGYRANRFPQLLDNFKKAPFFGVFVNTDKNALGYYENYLNYGTNGQVAGTHLHWMNKLTITGIIGFLLFLLIPFSFIKNNLLRFNSRFKYYYFLASLSILSYGLLKTLTGREAWYTFFIILPGLYYLPLLKNEQIK